MKRIPVAGPWITSLEIEYVNDAVRTAWYENANVYHARFEKAFADYVGRKHAIALPSCTSAIHLALAALGIGPGDEVIVPEITWIATAAPIDYVGATTVFADIDETTWCLSPESFARAITPRTKAVIPVDLYGNVADYPRIIEITDRHGIAVIEDAAQSAGADIRGIRAGAFGRASVFSFHGSKTLTTGEGGMLLTDDEALFRRAGMLRDHGRRPGDRNFFNDEVAFKYKMTALQAALGLAQLERIDELIERKRAIFSWYREELGTVDGVTLNAEPAGHRHVFWMVTAIVDPRYRVMKQQLQEAFDKAGIDTRPFFHPLSSLPAYRDRPRARDATARNSVAYRVSATGINLPSALSLDRDSVKYVCDTFKAALAARPS